MSNSAVIFASGRAVRWFLVALGLITSLNLFKNAFQPSQTPLEITHSSFDWSTLNFHYPLPSVRPLPTAPPQRLRRVQHVAGKPHPFNIGVEQKRCKAVKETAEKAWKNHQEQDRLAREQIPLSHASQDVFSSWTATLISSLDTLWIMGMKKEFKEAVSRIGRLDWTVTARKSCGMFEITTTYLGGLLAAYDLSQEPVLLEKAKELGDMLYMGFDTPNHMPPFWFGFDKARNGQLETEDNQPAISLSGLSMEFTRLSQLTGDSKYYDAIARIKDQLQNWQNLTKLPGMWPSRFDVSEGTYNHDNVFSLGAGSGTTYEYLLKMYALLGGIDTSYEAMYRNASATIINNLLFRPMTPKKLDVVFPGTFRVGDNGQLDAEIQHSSCFSGGMFALGGKLFNITEHTNLGARLTNGCMWAYDAFPHDLMPEAFRMVPCGLDGCKWDQTRWRNEIENDYEGREDLPLGFVSTRDPSYMLRPEGIESMFVMYRVTGHEEYREAAWKMFEAIQKATGPDKGNTALDDVTKLGVLQHRDLVESHWLAATLKYFYLMFSAMDYISLDEYVFNTEGHPFRIPT